MLLLSDSSHASFSLSHLCLQLYPTVRRGRKVQEQGSLTSFVGCLCWVSSRTPKFRGREVIGWSLGARAVMDPEGRERHNWPKFPPLSLCLEGHVFGRLEGALGPGSESPDCFGCPVLREEPDSAFSALPSPRIAGSCPLLGRLLRSR